MAGVEFNCDITAGADYCELNTSTDFKFGCDTIDEYIDDCATGGVDESYDSFHDHYAQRFPQNCIVRTDVSNYHLHKIIEKSIKPKQSSKTDCFGPVNVVQPMSIDGSASVDDHMSIDERMSINNSSSSKFDPDDKKPKINRPAQKSLEIKSQPTRSNKKSIPSKIPVLKRPKKMQRPDQINQDRVTKRVKKQCTLSTKEKSKKARSTAGVVRLSKQQNQKPMSKVEKNKKQKVEMEEMIKLFDFAIDRQITTRKALDCIAKMYSENKKEAFEAITKYIKLSNTYL